MIRENKYRSGRAGNMPALGHIGSPVDIAFCRPCRMPHFGAELLLKIIQ